MSSLPRLPAFFDKDQASTYDERFAKLVAMRDAIHLIMGSAFADLPANARILCVGAGTGAEVFYLSRKYPGWHFTAVEPAAAMLDVFRRRAAEEGISERCSFHEGYLDSLPPTDEFDAATSILVSQFILDPEVRREFFEGIATRLKPGGPLLSADLSTHLASNEGQGVFNLWLGMLASSAMPAEQIAQMRAAYERDVAILPPGEVEAIIMAGGFGQPLRILQTLLIRAWFARRAESIS
ncbi:class I SAM-dependent methyltransferase [Haloferula sp. BvORR071]|uniref:class I SAM-dependent methyltransferase n=1 Tax=Haloferula sp. BvORR071 TaxID=1396141 RepID=UPI000555603E|nr:class I SAM-dependent methyltransferase [Haloferula sp. BvORR071]